MITSSLLLNLYSQNSHIICIYTRMGFICNPIVHWYIISLNCTFSILYFLHFIHTSFCSSRLWVTHLNDPINVIMGYLLQSNLILLSKWDLSPFLLFRHLFSFFFYCLEGRMYVYVYFWTDEEDIWE